MIPVDEIERQCAQVPGLIDSQVLAPYITPAFYISRRSFKKAVCTHTARALCAVMHSLGVRVNQQQSRSESNYVNLDSARGTVRLSCHHVVPAPCRLYIPMHRFMERNSHGRLCLANHAALKNELAMAACWLLVMQNRVCDYNSRFEWPDWTKI